MAITRISAEDWKRMEPALQSCQLSTINMAKAVLVEGRKQSEVAKEFNAAKQSVNYAIKKVTAIFADTGLASEGLIHVEAWLPPEVAKKVQKIINDYKAKSHQE